MIAARPLPDALLLRDAGLGFHDEKQSLFLFVLGDLACSTHQTGQPLPGVAQVAKQGGWHAARMIRRRLAGQPTSAFHYLDFGSMATIGRAKAIADIGRLHVGGFVAWLMWLFIHLVWLVGFRSKVSAVSF